MSNLFARLSLPGAALLLLGIVAPLSRAQDMAALRATYDNDEVFYQLSGAAQSHLERLFGRKKPLVDLKSLQTGRDLTEGDDERWRAVPVESPSLAPIANAQVNNAAADATAQNTQSETAIVLGSGTTVIAGFNDSGSYVSGSVNKFTGWSRSANSGGSWTDQGAFPTSTAGDAGDPCLARSSSTGTLFMSTLQFTLAGMQIFRSTDNGTSWLAPVNGAPGGTAGNQDKEWIAVDNFAGTGFGNVYMAWRDFGSGGGIRFTRSVNDGVTWTPSPGLLLSTVGAGQGAWVAVGPDHSVYVFWLNGTSIVMRRSTDQGVSFAAQVTVTTLLTTGTNGDLGLGFRSNAFPQVGVNPVSGHLYIVYNDNPAGTDRGDVYFRISTNLGTTWSAATRVNTDTGLNDNWQPAIAVTPDGSALCVTWYDRRSDPANNMIERFGRNATISGSTVTFSGDYRISSTPFPPAFGNDPVVNSVYMGDYDQMAADNSFFYTTWGDNRNVSTVTGLNNADVFAGRIPKAGPGPTLDFVLHAISGGNGNGVVDVNECNNMQIRVVNSGSSTATSVTGTVTSLTPGAEVLNATRTYPSIAAGGTGENTAPFLLSTSTAFQCGSPILLSVTMSYAGGSNSFTVSIPTGSLAAPSTFNNNTPVPIVDLGTVTSSVGASVSGYLQKVTVSFYITHTFDADLDISLIGPDGTTIDLTSDNGSSGDNYGSACSPTTSRTTFDDAAATSITAGTAPFVGTFRPEQPLATFSGKFGSAVNGTWTLRITDDTGSDVGTLNCWSLSLYGATCVDGGGSCLPPSIAVSPPSLSFTVPVNAGAAAAVTVSNTATAGSDNLDWNMGDQSNVSLLLANGQQVPVRMSQAADLRTQEKTAQSVPEERTFEVPTRPLGPEETASGSTIETGSASATDDAPVAAPYKESFEGGNFDTWVADFGIGTKVITSTAIEGTRSFAYNNTGSAGHFHGIHQEFSPAAQPRYVRFYVRSSSVTQDDGYFVLTTNGASNLEVMWFFMTSAGKFYVNADLPSGDQTFSYAANTWYMVEYRNIDWVNKRFDYYVNGVLVKSNISMRNAASVNNIDRIYLHNFTLNAIAYWDGIHIGNTDLPWLNETPIGGSVAAASSADIKVDVDASGLAPGSYSGSLFVSSNDRLNPTVSIPVTLTVTPATPPPTEYGIITSRTDASIHILDVANQVTYGPYLAGGLGSIGQLLDAAITPDGKTGLVSSFAESRVYKIDMTVPTAPVVVDTATTPFAAEDVAVTPNGAFALVTDGGGSSQISVVRISNMTIVTTLDITPRRAQAVTVAPNNTVLVADAVNGQVHVLTINPTTGALADPGVALTAGTGATNIVVSPDGQTALCANWGGGTITVLRITGVGAVSVTGTIANMGLVQSLAFRPDGVRAYALREGVSPAKDSLVTLTVSGPGAVTDAGLRCGLYSSTFNGFYGVDELAVTSSGTRAYVTSTSLSSASVVNLVTNTLAGLVPASPGTASIAITAQSAPAGSNFAVGFNITDNCSNFNSLVFGTAPGLGPGFDPGFDQYAPPAPLPGAFDGRFRSGTDDFYRDFRGTNTGVRVWDVYYQPQSGCSPVTLSWNIGQLPPTGSFRLLDVGGGVLVNVNMRTQSSYTDLFGLGHLQIVYSLDATFTKTIAAGWNMVGLPSVVANPFYLAVFPTALTNTLFAFSGTYVARDTLKAGTGYWLRFGSAGSQVINGTFLNGVSIPLASGWNMIAGPSCNVPRTAISDPGSVIIPGTLFGFSGTYVASDTVKQGNGYWIRASAAGTIALGCGSPTQPLAKSQVLADLSASPALQISDAGGATQTLYLGVHLPEGTSSLSYSMPPAPHPGIFDARFDGDLRIAEGMDAMARIQSSSFPITVTYVGVPGGPSSLRLAQLRDAEELGAAVLHPGETMTIPNAGVNRVRITGGGLTEVPERFTVDQNYPNPFNPATEIRFGLPQDASVTVVVYNSLGQVIRTLVDEQRKAGFYVVRWNGDNSEGHAVGTGTYFYRVTAGTSSIMKKMLYLK